MLGFAFLLFLWFLDSKTESLRWGDCLLPPTSSQRGRELVAQTPGSEMPVFCSLFLSLLLQVQSRTDEEPCPHAWLCVRHQRPETKTLLDIPRLLLAMNVKENHSSCHFPSAPSLWVEFGCTGQTFQDRDTWNVPRYLQRVSASGAVKTSKVRQAQMFPDTAHDCYLDFKSLLL